MFSVNEHVHDRKIFFRVAPQRKRPGLTAVALGLTVAINLSAAGIKTAFALRRCLTIHKRAAIGKTATVLRIVIDAVKKICSI